MKVKTLFLCQGNKTAQSDLLGVVSLSRGCARGTFKCKREVRGQELDAYLPETLPLAEKDHSEGLFFSDC